MTLTSLQTTVGTTALLMATGAMGGVALAQGMPEGRVEPLAAPWAVAGGLAIAGSIGGAAFGIPDMLVRTLPGKAGDGGIAGPGKAGVIAAGIGAAVLVGAAALGGLAWAQHPPRSAT